MPSSFHVQISPILEIMQHEKPKSILDIGCGNGKYGFLLREYFPTIERLDAVEGFEKYIGTIQKEVYDHIFIGDIRTMSLSQEYDMYLLVDVIEHMSIQEGIDLVHRLPNTKLIATPKGWSPQGAENNNSLEIHQSMWTSDVFHKSFPDGAVVETSVSWIAIIPYTGKYLIAPGT